MGAGARESYDAGAGSFSKIVLEILEIRADFWHFSNLINA